MIISNGPLPYELSLEDLKKEHNSRPRNPLLANACFLGGYIDAWGRGTLKIIEACKEAGLPEPELVEKNGGVSMTLFVQTLINDSSDFTEKSSEKILELIKGSPEISAEELATIVGISSRAVEKQISALKKKERLKRVGSAKGGYWEVILDKNHLN
jgi:ATP-dependent DNA helicase RecG